MPWVLTDSSPRGKKAFTGMSRPGHACERTETGEGHKHTTAMHTHSWKWINPQVREKEQQTRLNTARRKFCPNSPFWGPNFPIEQHRMEMAEARNKRIHANMVRMQHEAARREELGLPEPAPVMPAFGGKEPKDNHSFVLGVQTVFTPSFTKRDKPIPNWPCKSEMKYEGDERISTDRLHGRFLGCPRLEGNETVNWMMRPIIDQYPLEEFHYPPPSTVDILMRTHKVAELEFSDEQGQEVLGAELMGILNLDDDGFV